MRDIVERLREVEKLCGEGFSSHEVIGMMREATEEVERLRVLLAALASDLAEEIEGHYRDIKEHPAMRLRYERDMARVYEARGVLGSKLR